MKRLAVKLAAVAVTFGTVAACSDDDTSPSKGNEDAGSGGESGSDAGDTGGSGGSGGGSMGTGGRMGSGGMMMQPQMCGDTECEPPPVVGMSPAGTACCTDDDECGLQVMATGEECMPRDQPGGRDLACPDVGPGDGGGVPGFGASSLPGCCSPDGCGGLIAGLGCVPRGDLGAAPMDCEYDEANDCALLVEIPCDGPEDCEDGEACCAQFNIATYTYEAIGCAPADSCAGMTAFPMCHSDEDCGGSTCLTSQYLPETLARCYTMGDPPDEDLSSKAGEINCGDSVCGDGEKCCLRDPNEPYCAPADEDCRCVEAQPAADGGTEAGAGDAGAEAGATDAGVESGASSEAGATDASAD